MLLAGLLVFFIREVFTGHLPNCSITTVNGIRYYDIPNFRFYQIMPQGFYIGFEGLHDVESIHIHVNINKNITINEAGDYNGLARRIFANKTRGIFGFSSSDPLVEDSDTIHMWVGMKTTDSDSCDYLLKPFPAAKYMPVYLQRTDTQ